MPTQSSGFSGVKQEFDDFSSVGWKDLQNG
jgi:hypothetical protein